MKYLDLAITVPVTINWMCFYCTRCKGSFISDSLPFQQRAESPTSELSEGKHGVNLFDLLAGVVPQLPFKTVWRVETALEKDYQE